MQKPAIGPNETIETVMPKLANPEPYLAGVIEKLRACKKTHGNASVRIGTTGSGYGPCYRIVYEAVEGAYIDSHKPFPTSAAGTFWSSKAMSLEEVEKLQAEKL